MKTTIIFIFGLLVLLSCSKDNPEPEELCYSYTAVLTDNCDCIVNNNNVNCGKRYYSISEAQYNKLLVILNASTVPCIYFDNKEFEIELDTESYLIELSKDKCPGFYWYLIR